ncbi:MAG: ABC transporter ATP-binding protein [Alphaproteobacteria bacterium]
MAEASLHGVTKRFNGVAAVDDVELSVADGEFLVLLGPTGAGKTTTLRLIAGLERPDAGRITIGGQDVTQVPSAERDVAFVFQQYSLYPHYTVFENLAFPLRAPGRRMKMDAIRERVGEIAETLRISHKLDNKSTQLSGGEMQRVSIGRALVRQPNVFLMDEPLSSLDAKLREDLRVELKRIQRELGATIVYVTHDQLEAMTLADRIGILDHGRLVQVDAPRVVYERPATVYAAQRLGSPPINLLYAGTLGLVPSGEDSVIAGVRPEDIELTDSGGAEAKVIALEHRGAEVIALMELDENQHIHALIDAKKPVREGETARLSVRPGSSIWFDKDKRLVKA